MPASWAAQAQARPGPAAAVDEEPNMSPGPPQPRALEPPARQRSYLRSLGQGLLVELQRCNL